MLSASHRCRALPLSHGLPFSKSLRVQRYWPPSMDLNTFQCIHILRYSWKISSRIFSHLIDCENTGRAWGEVLQPVGGCELCVITLATPPFVRNVFVAWNSHELEVFLAQRVHVDGILWTVWLWDLDTVATFDVGSTCDLMSCSRILVA